MLNRLRAFRERGWREVDAPTYAQAWQRFGGSVATHPLVVEQLAEMAGIPVRYLGWESAGELVAAIPTWGPTWRCPRTCSSGAARRACTTWATPN